MTLGEQFPVDSRVVIRWGIWQGIRGRVVSVDEEKQLVAVEFKTLGVKTSYGERTGGRTIAVRPFQPAAIRPLSVVEMIGELDGPTPP